MKSVRERFEAKYTVAANGCWIWTAGTAAEGYGRFYAPDPRLGRNRAQQAHRISYELYVGPIPEGLTLDHLCRTPACVNPKHLEPVTMRENILRGDCQGALNARKSACKNGHPYTPESSFVDRRGWRECRICNRQRKNEWQRKARREGRAK